MTLLIGALTLGCIMSLLAMGVYISFRIFNLADITVDGSLTLGASVCAVLIVNGIDPVTSTAFAFCVGALAGSITGILQTRFRINELLSGILVMTALYSVNLHVMGKSNIPLLSAVTLSTWAERLAKWMFVSPEISVGGWPVNARDLVLLIVVFLLVAIAGSMLYCFFRTEIGTAMRATGDNPQAARALGVSVEKYRIRGLALSNALVAVSGALLAQYQSFADAQMGIGMVVYGLASVIIGESLASSRQLGLAITGAIMGSVLFRLLIAIVLRWGLNPNDLKLITAVFVFCALVLPGMMRSARKC